MKITICAVKGKAAAIVQDAEAYQRLLDIAARADAREGIRQGLREAQREKRRDAEESFAESERRMAYRVEVTPRAQTGPPQPAHQSPPLPCTPEDKNLRHLLYRHKLHVYRVIYRVLQRQKELDVLHIGMKKSGHHGL